MYLLSTSIFEHILGRANQKPHLANTGLYLFESLFMKMLAFCTEASNLVTRLNYLI